MMHLSAQVGFPTGIVVVHKNVIEQSVALPGHSIVPMIIPIYQWLDVIEELSQVSDLKVGFVVSDDHSNSQGYIV
jgi:hypothetical protein